MKNVSTEALRLLYLSSGGQWCFRPTKFGEDFADDVAFQAPDNLSVALALFLTLTDIGNNLWVVTHSNDGHPVRAAFAWRFPPD